MTSFAVIPYDESRDEHKPKVGDVLPDDIGTVVKVVVFTSAVAFMRWVDGPDPDLEGARDIVVKHHPTRPFVHYACWVK